MKPCSPEELQLALKDKDQCLVVDVREPAEFEAEHVPGSLNLPLSGLASSAPGLARDKRIYLVCRSGARSSEAARLLAKAGFSGLRVLEGGLLNWNVPGGRVKGSCQIWSLDRQMRFTAGGLVLAGIVLGHWGHPYFLGLSVFVAAGLIFSALTDSCGLVVLLSKLPWNRAGKEKP